ncbi:hypothetical protein [Streptomyces sp. Ac-502]|uniref:hypothetical protein n=1 Tax=Streptomyces sp. Ac-502 TaxID=3342801 RepID=UPI003862334A
MSHADDGPARDASIVVAQDAADRLALLSGHFARDLTLGPQELSPTEADFTLSWWPMNDALTAAVEGRFLLPAGPLAQRGA